MPSIDSVSFDLTGCELRQRSKNDRVWVSDDAVALRLAFEMGRIDWPFDLTDADAASFFYFNQCNDNNGVMLSMEVITVAGGVEALRGLFKYHAPIPDSLGMCYVGILWLPFEACRFQINVESMELGTTGTREVAAMILEGDSWPQPPQDQIPHIENDEQLQAMYADALAKPPLRLPSDDAKYDQNFPDHPLSKVRARTDKIVETLKLDASTRSLQPFRI